MNGLSSRALARNMAILGSKVYCDGCGMPLGDRTATASPAGTTESPEWGHTVLLCESCRQRLIELLGQRPTEPVTGG